MESGKATDTDEDKDEVEEVQVTNDEEEEKEDERVEERNETERIRKMTIIIKKLLFETYRHIDIVFLYLLEILLLCVHANMKWLV